MGPAVAKLAKSAGQTCHRPVPMVTVKDAPQSWQGPGTKRRDETRRSALHGGRVQGFAGRGLDGLAPSSPASQSLLELLLARTVHEGL